MSTGALRWCLGVVLLLSILLQPFNVAERASAASSPRTLRVVFTHDLHSHLSPVRLRTADGNEANVGGFARLATVVRQEREQYGDATLVLDAGDFSMGTLFHTVFTTEALELRALGQIGFDATTIGNHELDFRSSGLADMLASARKSGDRLPSIVAANITLAEPDGKLGKAFRDYPVVEYTVVEKNGLRIGIFGLLGKDAADDVGFAPDVEFSDQIAAAKRAISALRDKEKVDVVVALSHCGTSAESGRSEDEILAREAPGIDLIVSGHTHTVLNQPIIVGNTTIVSSGSGSRYAGVVGLDFSSGTGRVTEYVLRELTTAVPDDGAVSSQVAAYQRIIEQRFLGPYNLTYDKAIAESDFDTEPSTYLDEGHGEAGLGNLIADSFRAAVQKAEGDRYDHIAAAIHPVGAIRGSFIRGPITSGDVFEVLSLGQGADNSVGYPLVTFYVTGAELESALEVESTLATLKSDYHLQVSGLKFAYNPNRVPLDRVTTLMVAGPDGTYSAMEPGRLYRVCVDYQVASMLGSITKKSFGILQLTPKDRNGVPLASPEAGLVDADPKLAGIQEQKAWMALADYLRGQPDPDTDGLPNLPERYKTTEGRISATASWAPADMLGGAGPVTFGFLAICSVILAIIYLLVRGVTSAVRAVIRR